MTSFRKKLLIELTIAIVVIGALGGGLLFLGSQIATYSEKIEFSRSELLNRWSSLYTLATLITQYNDKAETYLRILQAKVPDKDKLINFNKELQFLLSQSGLESSFSFLEEVPPFEDQFGALRFRLGLVGDLGQISKFIEDFKNFHYLTSIDSLTITGGGSKVNVTLWGKVLFR